LVDIVVSEYGLHLALLRIFECTEDKELIDATWKLSGLLCANKCNNNVSVLVDKQSLSILNSTYNLLNSKDFTLFKNCLFTLSNIVAEKVTYVKKVVELGLIAKLN
jgi:hypothetical protein